MSPVYSNHKGRRPLSTYHVPVCTVLCLAQGVPCRAVEHPKRRPWRVCSTQYEDGEHDRLVCHSHETTEQKKEFLESHPSGRATHTVIIKGEYFSATGVGNRTHNAIGMLNTAPRGGRNNARLLASGRVVTTRNVKLDDELLLAYGSSYSI